MAQFNRKTDPQIESNIVRQLGLRHMARPEQVRVDLNVIARLPSFNAAIVHCVGLSGMDRKQIYNALEIDAATWSRIESGQANFPLNKLEPLMDICANEAPLIWLLDARGYDWTSVREKQTEMERKVAALAQENADLRRLFRMQSQLGTEA